MSRAGGEIPRAGMSGRVLKLLVGAAQLWGVGLCLVHFGPLTHPSLDAGIWLFVALALWLLPTVVGLGFGRRRAWGGRPLLWVALIAGGAALWDLWRVGSLWGPAVASWLLLVTVYTHGHLGLSHVLAALVGLPGCEMRVLPYLWARWRGGDERAELELCPGLWTPLDRWEARLRGADS